MIPRGWKRSGFPIADVGVFPGGCGVPALFLADHGLVWFGGGVGWEWNAEGSKGRSDGVLLMLPRL